MATTAPKPTVSPSTRRALLAMYGGLALTLISMLIPVVLLATGDTLSRHIHDVYSAYLNAEQLEASRSSLLTYLYLTGGVAVVSWLWTIWAVRRQKRWARIATTIVFLLGASDAVINLIAEEYEGRVLPTLLGVAGLLPCLTGLAAVIFLWKRDRVPVPA